LCLLRWKDVADSASESLAFQVLPECHHCLSLVVNRGQVYDDSSSLMSVGRVDCSVCHIYPSDCKVAANFVHKFSSNSDRVIRAVHVVSPFEVLYAADKYAYFTGVSRWRSSNPFPSTQGYDIFNLAFYGLQLVVDVTLVCLERVDVACGHSSMSGVAVSFVLYISQGEFGLSLFVPGGLLRQLPV
jgi:hypothetical protein